MKARFNSFGTDGTTSKKWKRPILCPSRIALLALIRKDPGRIFFDLHGRAYGMMPSDNPLTQELMLSGEINNNQKLLWVFLPTRVQGIWLTPQIRKEKIRTEEDPLYLPYPDSGERIVLYNLLDYRAVLVLNWYRYVEHFNMQRRSAALLADITQLVSNPFVTQEDISRQVTENRIRLIQLPSEIKAEAVPLGGTVSYTPIKRVKEEREEAGTPGAPVKRKKEYRESITPPGTPFFSRPVTSGQVIKKEEEEK